MASVGNSGTNSKGKKNKSLNIDMTPMVDLGFLLITFFILTATLNNPVAMDINLPKDNKSTINTEVDSRAVINILLKKEAAYLYEGNNLNTIKQITYKELPKIIIKKKNWCIKNGFEKEFMIIIKASDESYYQQMVDMLNEMVINEVKTYTLVDISSDEEKIINQKFLR